jgi:hypothetical protein
MRSPQAVIQGIVQLLLPGARNDDNQSSDVPARMWPYGEQAVMPVMRKQHILCDEASYFVANNAQTSTLITTTAAVDYTKPYILVYNGNPSNGRNLYLDYASLTNVVAGSAASALTYTGMSVQIDTGNRYSSGGTSLTPKSPNMNSTSQASGASVYVGQITATAATGAARTIVGLRNIRPAVSATVAGVIGDNIVMNFGGVEGISAGTITIANPSIIPVALPPVVIGPGQSALICVFYAASGTPVAAGYAPELAFWER